MRNQTITRWMAGLLMLLATSGCQALYFLTGRGKQKAQYEFSANSRVLVMVDVPPNSGIPVSVETALGQAIAENIFARQQEKKKSEFVAQARLTALRARGEQFAHMSIADIAQAVNADYVIYVKLQQFTSGLAGDGQISEAAAQGDVKVVWRYGTRAYPKDPSTGVPVAASLPPAVGDAIDVDRQRDALIDILASRIGSMFYAYDLDNPNLGP